MKSINIAVIESSPADSTLIEALLGKIENCDFKVVNRLSSKSALNNLKSEEVDIIILGSDSSSEENFFTVQNAFMALPIVVMTEAKDSQRSVNLISQGAYGLIRKDEISSEGLVNTLYGAIKRLQTEEALKKANSFKNEIVANVSHELRTPLSSILGYSEVLADPTISEDTRKDCILRVRKNVHTLTELIDRVLDISHLETGKIPITKKEFSLLSELTDFFALFKERARVKNLGFHVNFKSAIPSTIVSDPQRVRDILNNILENALKFTEEGSITVDIEFQQVTNGTTRNLLKLTIKDTGCGISKEHTKKLFEMFSQVDGSYTRKHGGFGIGLYLSKKIIRRLGGEIELLESAPGKGTTFLVTVDCGTGKTQLIDDVTKYDLHLQNVDSLKLHNTKLDGTNVLIVEDDQDCRDLISHFLMASGANVEVAKDGMEGLDKAASHPFDLILMDIQMPNLDGYQTTRKIRGRGDRTPIIVLTANALKEEYEKAQLAGCNGYLTKPIDRISLISAVESYKKRMGIPSTPYPIQSERARL